LQKTRAKWLALGAAGVAAVAGAAAVSASGGDGVRLTSVATANTRAAGYAPPNKLSPELQQIVWAQGSTKLENPSGIVTNYGYENDVSSTDDPSVPRMIPVGGAEAQKTEPDKNTYLVFKDSLAGADGNYAYGTHFLFQGHEAAASNAQGKKLGYLTRINLDADAAHRVTLLATQDSTGNPLATIDGSTWDPWAGKLVLTTENASAPTYEATPGYPSTVDDISGSIGRGGYEGIQNDSDGNLWIVEDIGGSNKPGGTARHPNSYVYRFVPDSPDDLTSGRLEALQVLDANRQPITWDSLTPVNSAPGVAVHTYGKVFDTRWVTVHDTTFQGTAPFNANDLAKAAKATPFKRPENGLFRPGTHFRSFFFDETGDTNLTSPENGDPVTGVGGSGGFGSIMELTQKNPSAKTGQLTLFFAGTKAANSLDNVAWLSEDQITFVEDAGETMHGQRNALDSGWVFDADADYAPATNPPVRWIAQGRDPSATTDAANGGFGKNDQDNELTGTTVSNGDPTEKGILGAKKPDLLSGDGKWRWFYTQQHGDNVTYEVIDSPTK
jgi:hypothetical protein